MVTVNTVYEGNLRTRAEHLLSGNIITTDAPVDNQGKGEAFSPTDLVAAALGSCMLTIMGIAARMHDFNIDGTRCQITKVMTESPRRIAQIVIGFYFPETHYSDKEKKIIEYAARNCPVSKSLHPDLEQTVTFHFN